MPQAAIAVFGAAHVDRIAKTLARAVPGASNPGVVHVAVGGVGLNVATALARLGRSVAIASRVGTDPDGDRVLAHAARWTIDAAATSRSSASTASYNAVLDADGSLIVGIADMAIYEELTPTAIEPAADRLRGAALWAIDANLPQATIEHLLDGRRPPTVAFAVSPAKVMRFAGRLDRIDTLILNRAEARALTADPSIADAPIDVLARAVIARGVRAGVLTDGGGLVAVWQGGRMDFVMPPEARIVSVNGAGDALSAGTIHGLSFGLDLAAAVRYGVAAASLALESADPLPPHFDAAAVSARLDMIPQPTG